MLPIYVMFSVEESAGQNTSTTIPMIISEVFFGSAQMHYSATFINVREHRISQGSKHPDSFIHSYACYVSRVATVLPHSEMNKCVPNSVAALVWKLL
eukprot:474817-Amphidinium_carterae.3